MRSLVLVLSAVLVLCAGPADAQDNKEKARPPKSGDTIVVEGCLNGTMLEGAGSTGPDGSNAFLPSLNYQLKGKKKVLKNLVTEHDGQVVEITGVLKSNIDTGGIHGTKIGNTRIVIGVQSTNPDRGIMTPATQELLPVLEVKSYASRSVNCRR